jgi:SCY1-like protein 1
LVRLVRDQANKTLDIYLQRVRKHSLTLPDTAIPPATSSEASSLNAPRMGTPQNDTSWAGWAISSFTNKLAAASGEIQATDNTGGKAKDNRSSTAHPTMGAISSKSSPGSTLHQYAVASPPSIDFHNSRGDHGTNSDDFDAWGDMEEETFFDAPAEVHPTSSATANTGPAKASFDDGGEPDFAGWLSAQAQAKTKAHLPKGLARSSTTSTTQSKTSSRTTLASNTGNIASTKKVVNPKSKSTAVKTADTKPKDQGWTDDDGWGDSWE